MFYLQIFTGVQCGFLLSRGRSVNDFVQNPMNHVRIFGRNRICYPCPLAYKFAGSGGTKILCLTYPHTEKSMAIVVARPSFHSELHRCTTPWCLAGFLSSSARVECHLAVWMKTWGLGATFETHVTQLLILVQK